MESTNLHVTHAKYHTSDKQESILNRGIRNIPDIQNTTTLNQHKRYHPKQQTRIRSHQRHHDITKHINKTTLLISFEQLYSQSYHHHKQLISEQQIGEHTPTY